ncbi:MAG: EAL domain-containing protein [Proteobacteria bacterium]|nr:EAL domain-containing protein [Pseudomonadota bacterium]
MGSGMWGWWKNKEQRQAQELQRLQAQLHAAQAEQRLADVVFQIPVAVLVTSARGVIERINAAFTQLTGYAPDEVVGKTPWLLRSGHHDEAFYVAMRASIQQTGRWQGEIWDRHKDGSIIPKWMTITAAADAQGQPTHFVATYVDISERKRAEEERHQLAFYDALTRLPNRTLALERLQHAISASARSSVHGAVLLIDLDDFKRINDSAGHAQGDVLLQQVAGRLLACVGAEDTVARMGGDEFLLVLAEACTSAEKAAAHIEQLAARVLHALGQDYLLGGDRFRCGASIGAALFAKGAPPAQDVVKQAELAMYQAKQEGGGKLHFFDAALEQAVARRVQLERELDEALAQGHLALHYQPQVAPGGQVVGAEALVRWRHPERGLVSPGEFIPLAEDTGQILPLGAWVLQTACDQLAAWAGQPHTANLTLAVNVSALQFGQSDFVAQVAQAIERSGARPQLLKLELTESMLVDDVDGVIAKMHALRALGLRLSLDDFGTGYSSLAYLRRMPIDQLKIDQSFVRDLLQDANAMAIARSVAALGHSLGLDVVAEGVETAAQRDALADLGCASYQGYFFGRPVALPEFEAWLARLAAP